MILDNATGSVVSYKIRDGGKISERRNIHKAGPPLKSY